MSAPRKASDQFETEAALCASFIGALPKGWTAYPETGGFDILLSRDDDGFQIGVEAKLRLNAKVICQAAEYVGHYYVDSAGPDCRAVLIPSGVSMDLSSICAIVGITVIQMTPEKDAGWGGHRDKASFRPELPDTKRDYGNRQWQELCPAQRLTLPEWVPDVPAGASAPVALTDWKVRAIKLVVILERRGFVTRKDFAYLELSMSRWTQSRWLVQDGKGGWVAGDLPDFRKQHPINFEQIAVAYDKWKNPKEVVRTSVQETML